MRQVYCDHAATTPVHPEVAAVMMRMLTDDYGNASSLHAFGRSARKQVELAREQVAGLLGARPGEVFFTSGGTEADNWAIRGAAYANRARGQHIITTAIEHHAVLDACAALEREGFTVTYLPVLPRTGLVDPEALRAALRAGTVLVSIMHVNNEVGTVQEISALSQLVKAFDSRIIFHTDAVQSAGIVPLNVQALGVDMATISAHKIYGPKGVGALYARKGFRFAPILFGGGQERKMRPGTENVAGIVGFGKAAELARQELPQRAEHARTLRNRFLAGLSAIPDVLVNGPDPFARPDLRHPGNLNISVRNVESEAILLRLDMKGIAVSSGSACSAGAIDPSHVILAIGRSREEAASSLRWSFGTANTVDDIDYILGIFQTAVASLRAMAPQAP